MFDWQALWIGALAGMAASLVLSVRVRRWPMLPPVVPAEQGSTARVRWVDAR
jgi:hypothetical protein